jgi:glyoxylase-like metal-dependent hydrolase (beta-lactamase superfamily II)
MTGPNDKTALLQWSVFITKRPGLNRELPPGYESLAWVPNSSTLIYGERDAVLVDTFLTAEASQALADWVMASGKNLTTIYLTHSHGDHFFGIGLLKQRFPHARAVARPDIVEAMRRELDPPYFNSFWNSRFPGQLPEQLAVAEALEGNTIELEGHELSWSTRATPTRLCPRVCTSRPSTWWWPGTSPTTASIPIWRKVIQSLGPNGSLPSTNSIC